jgi:hypothetical protein
MSIDPETGLITGTSDGTRGTVIADVIWLNQATVKEWNLRARFFATERNHRPVNARRREIGCRVFRVLGQFTTGRIVELLLAELEEQRAVTGAVQPG